MPENDGSRTVAIEEGITITLRADANQVDDTGYVWSFLSESPDPSRIWPGAIVVAGDSDEPFLARVVDIVETSSGEPVVHLDVVGVPGQVIDELRRTGLLPS